MWMLGLVSVAIFAMGGTIEAQASVSSPGLARLGPAAVVTHVSHTTTTISTTTTSTTTPPPAPATLAAAPVTPPPAPVTPPPPAAPALPAYGHATTWGCTAALAYLQAYAAPGFALDCPGYAEGHEAMTCLHGTPQYPDACPSGPTIAIADACPQAYMNESANSWYMTGQLSTEQQKFGVSYDSIDPFGACP
jgi:hypothetical protein